MLKKSLLLPFAALALAALACNLPNVNLPRLQTGPTETVEISESAPDVSGPVDLTIRMGAGKLNLAGGAEKMIEGQVQYNVADWKPQVSRSGSSVTVEQRTPTSNTLGLPQSGQTVVNDWSLKLGNTPLNLTVQAGAYDGVLDLSGVPLKGLRIQDGASTAEVVFNEVNPEEMTRLTYETGASTVKLTGLANANFAAMDFTGGAGSYTLDFTGELQRDADVTVKAGVSTIRLVAPEGMPVKVVVNGGLNDVSTIGSWAKDGSNYSLTGNGPTLTIHVEMGVGSLTLVSK